ncbi:MAG: response regulator [Bacteroidota bacterium]
MQTINLAVVDDSAIYIDGLSLVLKQSNEINLIYTVSSGEEFLKLLSKQKPDITLMDIKLPGIDGIKTTIEALKINPGQKIIALTMHESPDFCNQMKAAGAYGYLLKKAGKNKIIETLKKVNAGEKVFQYQTEEKEYEP